MGQREAPTAEQMDRSFDRILAAIVPDGKRAWFFKLNLHGVSEQELQRSAAESPSLADQMRGPLRDFLATVKVAPGDEKPSWTLPPGWREESGDAARMRAATIVIPVGAESLEIAVSTLPMNEPWGPFVEKNVNRWLKQLDNGWLKQLDQAELSEETIAQLAHKLKTGSGEASLFELRGILSAAPMGGAMPAGHPPIGDAASTETASSSPDDENTPAAAASADVGSSAQDFSFKLPPGWQAGPAAPMRKGTFVVDNDDGRGELAVTSFPAIPAMADPLQNARRWASLAAAGTLSDEQLQAAIHETKIAGLPAQQMVFFPADNGAGHAIAAAMVRRGEEVWFFKLSGPKKLIESQRAAFAEFLGSVKW